MVNEGCGSMQKQEDCHNSKKISTSVITKKLLFHCQLFLTKLNASLFKTSPTSACQGINFDYLNKIISMTWRSWRNHCFTRHVSTNAYNLFANTVYMSPVVHTHCERKYLKLRECLKLLSTDTLMLKMPGKVYVRSQQAISTFNVILYN